VSGPRASLELPIGYRVRGAPPEQADAGGRVSGLSVGTGARRDLTTRPGAGPVCHLSAGTASVALRDTEAA
jgi:hypothetical protein